MIRLHFGKSRKSFFPSSSSSYFYSTLTHKQQHTESSRASSIYCAKKDFSLHSIDNSQLFYTHSFVFCVKRKEKRKEVFFIHFRPFSFFTILSLHSNLVSQSTSNDYKGAVYQNETSISSPARRSEVSPIQNHVSISNFILKRRKKEIK